jgi:hypothetical protein
MRNEHGAKRKASNFSLHELLPLFFHFSFLLLPFYLITLSARASTFGKIFRLLLGL